MTQLKDFKLDPLKDLQPVGTDLSRPECVVAEKDGTLWVSDNRHAITRIYPDGRQEQLGTSGETNGMTMDGAGNLYVADWAENKVLKIYRDGRTETVLQDLNGEPLGPVNYVFCDSQDRLWVAISARRHPWFAAAAAPAPDGHVILVDSNGARIVADGITFTNEIRLDRDEKYLYVAETMAAKISRFPVNADGSLGAKETFGPESLGDTHFVDGFAFDAEGNVWVTTVLRNGLMVIDAQTRQAYTIFEDANHEALAAVAEALPKGQLTPEHMFGCMGQRLRLITSINFGGEDLKTVYIGSLAMDTLMSFRSPVAGMPMRHWNQ
ncbi:SMP-30/gluconolactonase/LRE family protein [Eisenibacter elegans]|jgi:sugar lactone lactonase YvrE|uniref:SMP-30/gluconolactonase/LRE family protein n=1 Tax=Eisenibacter elegans TaxID=997 RepID=UPI000428F906|nr:SMP-30/gluconolactonase/LRE family protein [Eisenibacter elegans]